MKRRSFLKTCAAGAGAGWVSLKDVAVGALAPAEDAFRRPPASARPYTWWHWMNGNITAEGITRDLEAMARVGVGGFQLFQVGTGIPKGPVAYGSAEHLKLLEHAAREAMRLGMEFDLHNCPGWCSSGGPWITPEYAMQQLAWSETYVRGGQRVQVKLLQPLARLNFYRDAFVIAFPSLEGETQAFQERVVRLSAGTGDVDRSILGEGSAQGVEVRPGSQGEPAFLLLEFAEPFEARSVLLASAGIPGGPPGAGFGQAGAIRLEASDDGKQFRTVATLRAGGAGFGAATAPVPAIAEFAPVRARFFRLLFPAPRRVMQLRLSSAARIPGWVFKANFARPAGSAPAAEPVGAIPSGSVIDPEKVLDLTAYMKASGELEWDAPAGNWTVLRLGWTPTGRTNHPGPDGGVGLECDKYSAAAMDFHFNHFFGPLLAALRPLAEKGLAGALIDSYEVGMQNWTPEFPKEFEKRRGYDLRRYLPAMTGRIVGSLEISERFLWDVRRTQADLMSDNYYGRFAELCRKHGFKAYTEPYEGGPFEEMQAGSRMDVCMGEFWIGRGNHRSVKLAASIAHVFGQPVVGAEAFTGAPPFSKWQEHPYSMKALGDWMFTQGLNRFIFHRYAHQPHPTAVPGMTMGPWGFHFDRTNTWFEKSKPWLEYIARCQHMLQQGVFVADLLYFSGEDAPVDTPDRNRLDPTPPEGHDWDTINAEGLLRRVRVEDGKLVLPDGTTYRVLVLQRGASMTLPTLRKIQELVREGAWVCGPRPESSPSLADRRHDAEFRRIASEVWGELDGSSARERAYGRGRVFWGEPLRGVLDRLKLGPDFEWTARAPDADINYIHRRTADADIYFVANRRRRFEDTVCTFRVEGKEPEFWDPATGSIAAAPVYTTAGYGVRVPIRFEPAGSVFVVFRSPARGRQIQVVSAEGRPLLSAAPFPAPAPRAHQKLAGRFTVSVWVKPEVEAPLPGGSGAAGFMAQPSSFIFYPAEGEVAYGAGHASCGMMAGRTGVAVYECTRGQPHPVLVHRMPLAGWTHLALIYEEGAPRLYVNGRRVAEGKSSGKVVHPGLGEALSRRDTPHFEGEAAGLQLFGEVLGDDRIRELASQGPPPEAPPDVDVCLAAPRTLLIWRNGRYSLRDGTGRESQFEVSGLAVPVRLKGPWRVTFPPNLGAPPEVSLPELISLHRHPDPGVQYFSGTATYRTTFDLEAIHASSEQRVFLDLGRVEVIAEVQLNGRECGILWKPPFRVDVTDVVRRGDNELRVMVTTLWPNRLIGDEQLPPEADFGEAGRAGFGNAIAKLPQWYVEGKPKPAGGRVTFTTWRHYSKDSPLLESGLLGPVLLRRAVWHRLES